MSSDDSDEKIALLKQIRDEVREWRVELLGNADQRIGGIRGDIHALLEDVNRGFDRIDVALADYAEQVRLTVHYTKVLAKQWGIEIEPARRNRFTRRRLRGMMRPWTPPTFAPSKGRSRKPTSKPPTPRSSR